LRRFSSRAQTGRHWRNGWGPAFVTGVAVGAIATYPYYDDCWAYEPVYDAYGNYLGQQYVNLCLP